MSRGHCMRCGFARDDLRTEWTSLVVCGPCWDPKPSDLKPPKIGPEGLPRKPLAPEPEDYEVAVNEITAADL